MASAAERQRLAINVWTARCIPVILAGIVGYATYVVVVPLCAHYLLAQHHDVAAAVVILVIHFPLFLLMSSSFFRLVYITMFDPPYLEKRGPDKSYADGNVKTRPELDGIAGKEYSAGNRSGDDGVAGTKDDPDSPGLELFYAKDIFVCEIDGRPKWCSHCANWKPDRTHHCSDSGRCIRKMDHFCPWVGGPVGESNFKFFIQFTGYTALYCIHLLIVMAFYIARQKQREGETYNPQFAAILGLATSFFLFTASMAATSINFALKNLTQVENLGLKTRVQTLAVLKPAQDQLYRINPLLASQHPYQEITYPLAINEPPVSTEISNTSLNTSNYPSMIPVKQSEPIPNPHSPGLLSGPPGELAGTEPQPSDSRLASGVPPRIVQSSSILPTSISAVDHQDENPQGSPEDLHPGSELSVETQVTTSELANRSVQPRLFDRDLQATRTFAILNLKQGENPWDLGTRLLNWKSVMGSNIVDWLLPIKRSPCCNHDDAVSQFQVGPAVDDLRASVGFLRPKDIRAFGGHKKLERRNAEEVHADKWHKKFRRRKKRRNDDGSGHVALDDLEHQAPQNSSI